MTKTMPTLNTLNVQIAKLLNEHDFDGAKALYVQIAQQRENIDEYRQVLFSSLAENTSFSYEALVDYMEKFKN